MAQARGLQGRVSTRLILGVTRTNEWQGQIPRHQHQWRMPSNAPGTRQEQPGQRKPQVWRPTRPALRCRNAPPRTRKLRHYSELQAAEARAGLS